MTALTVLRTTWVHHDIQAVRRSAAAVSSISPSPLLEEEEEEEEEEEDFLPSLDARRAGRHCPFTTIMVLEQQAPLLVRRGGPSRASSACLRNGTSPL